MIDGKPQRLELVLEITNKLAGTSQVAFPAALKGAVQLPSGKTVNGKFLSR